MHWKNYFDSSLRYYSKLVVDDQILIGAWSGQTYFRRFLIIFDEQGLSITSLEILESFSSPAFLSIKFIFLAYLQESYNVPYL